METKEQLLIKCSLIQALMGGPGAGEEVQAEVKGLCTALRHHEDPIVTMQCQDRSTVSVEAIPLISQTLGCDSFTHYQRGPRA